MLYNCDGSTRYLFSKITVSLSSHLALICVFPQIDKLLDFIEDKEHFDDLPEIEVTADFVAQKGVFLAYL